MMKNQNTNTNDCKINREFLLRLLEREQNSDLTDNEKQILKLWDEKGNSQFSEQELKAASARIWTQVNQQFQQNNPIQNDISARRPKNIFTRFSEVAAAAAIILICVLGTVFYNNNQSFTTQQQSKWVTFSTNSQELKNITLPDGSAIRLNNATTFAYRTSEFNTSKREVWLKEGEAFFEVAKNPKKPFIVNYAGMQTVVLGTSFNIKAFKESGESSVTVRTGRVLVRKEGKKLGVLTKDDRLVFNFKHQKTKISIANADETIGWTLGKLTFEDAPFSEIAMKIKMKYQIDAVLQNVSEDKVRLTATFTEDEKITNIATAVAGVNGLEYKIEGGKIIFFLK